MTEATDSARGVYAYKRVDEETGREDWLGHGIMGWWWAPKWWQRCIGDDFKIPKGFRESGHRHIRVAIQRVVPRGRRVSHVDATVRVRPTNAELDAITACINGIRKGRLKCPQCKSARWEPSHFKKNGFRVYSCIRCGHRDVDPRDPVPART
jgi:hypothetical protein